MDPIDFIYRAGGKASGTITKQVCFDEEEGFVSFRPFSCLACLVCLPGLLSLC
jgi:hypothetical protein